MRLLIFSLLIMAQAGCAKQVAGDGPVIQVMKSRGSVQCGSQGLAPELMQKELQDAGIAVQRVACGSDGRMRIAMCNAPDGRINIFDIAASAQSRAEALGYTLLAPGVREVPCP